MLLLDVLITRYYHKAANAAYVKTTILTLVKCFEPI